MTVRYPQPVVVQTSTSPYAKLQALPLTAVTLTDALWKPRQAINRTITLPSQYQHCETTGRIDNFRRAAGAKAVDFQGMYFNDSDVYKWLEGVAWELAHGGDASLADTMARVIVEIAAAQQADGYLNTYFMFDKQPERWTNTDFHELYCAGHLMQAAVAHFRVTGTRELIEVASRLADHICDTFGPAEEGKEATSDGHPEVEMALVELYRATGNERYLEQAHFFIDVRGSGEVVSRSGGRLSATYAQDHMPFRTLDRMYGHAVRALYLNSGAADLYLERGEPALLASLERQWHNMTFKQLYISGGLGSRWEGEAFGDDYELPHWAYAETCAAIASVMWNWRMLLITGEARYSDLMEQTLYNGVLCGLSQDGQHYFYQNPLVDEEGKHHRSPWFTTSCCPTNLARFLPTLGQYFYSTSDEGLWIHLYGDSSTDTVLVDGKTIRLRQETRYPWDGNITFTLESSGDFALFLRIPAWCSGASAVIGAQDCAQSLEAGSYVKLQRHWHAGDEIVLTLPMPVQYVVSNSLVSANRGRAALTRGPLLYCLEQADNPGVQLDNVVLRHDVPALTTFEADLLGGITALTLEADLLPNCVENGALYTALNEPVKSITVRAVPYYAWANRAAGPMQVWMRYR